jgi:hypothetical protein
MKHLQAFHRIIIINFGVYSRHAGAGVPNMEYRIPLQKKSGFGWQAVRYYKKAI